MHTLPRALPWRMGVDPEAIRRLVAALDALDCHSIMIARHGHVVAEGWWAPYRADAPHASYSISKGVTAIAVGFAVQEGLLTVEDRVIDHFPDLLPCAPCAHMRELTVKHLLMMGLGHFSRMDHDFYFAENWLAENLRLYLESQPGTRFNYDNRCALLCSAIVQRLTGQTLFDYLTPRLFVPLGIRSACWELTQGINPGGWGLAWTTEDILTFSQFLLQKGAWNGAQLLDPAWISAASSCQINSSTGRINGNPLNANQVLGYGYLFWMCPPHGAYRGTGACGQQNIVLPEQDMVIAITAGSDRSGDILDAVWEHLLPGLRDDVAEDASAQNALNDVLAGLRVPLPAGTPDAPAASLHSGKTYRLADNPCGITALSFTFGDVDTLTLYQGERRCTVRVGHGTWLANRGAVAQAACPDSMTTLFYADVACAGAWSGSRYELKLAFTGTPFVDTLAVTFDGQRLEGVYRCAPYLPLRGRGTALMGCEVTTGCAV